MLIDGRVVIWTCSWQTTLGFLFCCSSITSAFYETKGQKNHMDEYSPEKFLGSFEHRYISARAVHQRYLPSWLIVRLIQFLGFQYFWNIYIHISFESEVWLHIWMGIDVLNSCGLYILSRQNPNTITSLIMCIISNVLRILQHAEIVNYRKTAIFNYWNWIWQ